MKKEKKELKDEVLLFGTKTCPNCKMAEKLLEKAKVEFRFIDAEENVESDSAKDQLDDFIDGIF